MSIKMNKKEKVEIIVRALETASDELKLKISIETLFAGVTGYIEKWNPPARPKK